MQEDGHGRHPWHRPGANDGSRPVSSSRSPTHGGAAERRLDLAARERLLAALDRLEPGMARIERELDALEALRLARLAEELRTPSPSDGLPAANDAAASGIPDEILEESLLSGLSERTEDFIATCRKAIPPEQRRDGETA